MTDLRSPAQSAGINVKALWSLPLAVLFSIVGVILAHLARREIRRTGERGIGLTTAALLIGYPTMLVWSVCWVSLSLAVPLTE
jgi:peptidoglycan/LPS O-acetylase OafA/YrhL